MTERMTGSVRSPKLEAMSERELFHAVTQGVAHRLVLPLYVSFHLPCSATAEREDVPPPVQRNIFYEPIKVLESLQTVTIEAEPPPNKSKVLEDNLATA